MFSIAKPQSLFCKPILERNQVFNLRKEHTLKTEQLSNDYDVFKI